MLTRGFVVLALALAGAVGFAAADALGRGAGRAASTTGVGTSIGATVTASVSTPVTTTAVTAAVSTSVTVTAPPPPTVPAPTVTAPAVTTPTVPAPPATAPTTVPAVPSAVTTAAPTPATAAPGVTTSAASRPGSGGASSGNAPPRGGGDVPRPTGAGAPARGGAGSSLVTVQAVPAPGGRADTPPATAGDVFLGAAPVAAVRGTPARRAVTLRVWLRRNAWIRLVVRGPLPRCSVALAARLRGQRGENRLQLLRRKGRRILAPGRYAVTLRSSRARRPIGLLTLSVGTSGRMVVSRRTGVTDCRAGRDVDQATAAGTPGADSRNGPSAGGAPPWDGAASPPERESGSSSPLRFPSLSIPGLDSAPPETALLFWTLIGVTTIGLVLFVAFALPAPHRRRPVASVVESRPEVFLIGALTLVGLLAVGVIATYL